MKANLLNILLLSFVLQIYAQHPHKCEIPVPDHIFRQKQKSIAIQPTEDLKFQVASAIAVNNCLSVDQVKIIAAMFINDFKRLDFAKTAWHNTVDKENFYYVYDDFAYFSTVFMLHDYIKTMEAHPMDYLPPAEPPVSLSFPMLDYPAYDNYAGPSNCNRPMPEAEFLRQASQVAVNNSEASRMLLLTQIAENDCLSVSQAMKFASLLTSEPNRLTYMQKACNTIFDLKNLPYGAQLFAHIPNKAAYNDFISRPVVIPVTPPPCSINAEEFGQIKESVQKESFNSTRLTIAKQIIRSKQCFTTRQVVEIVKLFSFDDTRVELAKFAWEFTIDKDNFYQVSDALTFSSSKEELMKFLDSKGE